MIVASIDIGTNTILLLIAEVDIKTKNISPILNEYAVPRIGRGLKKGSNFPQENITRLFNVLKKYKKIIDDYNCDKIILSATNAFRIASNSNEVVKNIKDEFNFDVNIISGDEESKYAFLGVSEYVNKDETLFVIDIGGGSTELIFGTKNRILFNKSFDAGVVSGKETYFINDPPTKDELHNFEAHLKEVFLEINKNKYAPDESIAIAGTPTTLACIKQDLKEFDEDKVEGSTLSKKDLIKFRKEFLQLSSKEIKQKYKEVINNREDLILAGTCILLLLLELLKLDKILVSTKGIRFGAIRNYILNNY